MARPLPNFCSEDVKRFWSKVKKNKNGCWMFTGNPSSEYGQFKAKGVNYNAPNRIAYFLHYGIDPGDLVVRHSCDTPKCVCPEHLSLGTPKDNVKDMYDRGRDPSKKGSNHGGARLKEEDVVVIKQRKLEGASNKELSELFKVSRSNIEHIVNGRRWNHVVV